VIDAERIFRDAVDEPTPPDPPEPVEDEGDDGGRHIHPLLVVFPDGGVAATEWRGHALIAGFWFLVGWASSAAVLATLDATYRFALWLYGNAGLALLVVALGISALASVLTKLLVRLIGRLRRRKP
jgi:hypothetical protein